MGHANMDHANMDHANMDHVSAERNQELDQLFERYRASLPDPEASVNFMPTLWRKIEARQMFVARLKKLTQVFVAAAAAICLLLGILLQAPMATETQTVRGNYVDVLADANPAENLAALGIKVDYTEPNGR
jgi:hypothetical protein